jgi:hypothetical protein
MTRLTLVVGQQRSVLVAGTLLIVACGSNAAVSTSAVDAAVPAPDATTTVALPDGATPDATPLPDAAATLDATSQPADAASDGYKSSVKDASVVRDTSSPWPDAAPLPGGGPPAPWQGRDIGMVARPGDTTATGSSFTVVSGGGDIGGAADSFHFVHQPLGVDAELPPEAYVGLATEAHGAAATVQAVYNYATIDNLAADPATAAWEPLDVGTVGGSAAYAAGVLTLTGLGEPFTPAQDYFGSVVQAVSGSYRLTARVSEQSSSEPEARAGLMFREGLVSTASRMSAQASITVSPGKGVQFFSRSAQGGMTAAGARAMEVKAPVWLRLEKLEMGAQDLFTGWYSLDGASWTMLDSASFTAAQPLLMGIVAGAGNARVANVVKVDGITASAAPADGGAGDATTSD